MGRLRRVGVAVALAAAALATEARADTTLVVLDVRPAERAQPGALEVGRTVRGDPAIAVREVTPELPEGVAQASQAFDAASEALTRFEDGVALDHVAAAERALRHVEIDDKVRDLLVRLNWVAARAHSALGRRARADAACRLAHSLAPDRRLPRGELPPEFIAQCERAAGHVPAAVPFTVATDPPGARLTLDLAPLDGTAPTASAGDHYLRADAPGRVASLRRVEIAANAALSFELPLESLQSRIGRAIAAATTGAGSWRAVTDAVATTGAIDVVVVLHDEDRVSAFDARGGALARDATLAQARTAITTHLRGTGGDADTPSGVRGLGGPSDRRDASPTPWYRRAWVWVAVVAVVGGTAGAFALANRSESENTYVIDGWTLAQ